MTTVAEPGVREQHATERLERILTASRELFSELGDAVSMEQIAKRSGVGIGSLYRRFPSKDDLLWAVVESECRRLGDVAKRHAAEHLPSEALFGFMREWAARPSLCRALSSSGSLSADAHLKLLALITPGASALLTSGQTAGAVRPDATVSDLIMIIVSTRMVGDRGGDLGVPAASRHLELLLDAIRPGHREIAARPLGTTEVAEMLGNARDPDSGS